MKFFSSRLGELNIDETIIINFPEGIPGFNDFKKYVIIQKDNNKTFFILHSVENKDLAFIITYPFFFTLDYSIEISDEDCELLKIDDVNKLGIFVITKIDKDKNLFINLKAPLCINFEAKLGKQIILYDKDYSPAFKIEKTCLSEEQDLKEKLTLMENKILYYNEK